ncbi:hypothetical protein GL325_02815 [Aeromicrobium sp. 636]|uniref:Uncharacterized protein n=1 Tax=Aeromicrobium senzhongii TaxID=2663859 RepID=A0A8I0JZZ7_9ACTN|nr:MULTISPECIES: hypothetical protein [Aeromicrobium]MBC9225248.1 hypothetical protein [Aeromicrobium senzhongii]MCQ3997358.1 hypothetical protein [Aeromicrobium sp. 636]
MDDATAHVAGLLEANPALESKGSYVLDRGIVGSVGSQLSVPAEETRVSASYVFYARRQWQRVMLDGQVDSDTGMAALDRLADSAAFAADDMGVHAVEHEGVGAVPADTEAVRRDFETNCSHGFGDAPGAR